jgi:hypothetical protein
MSATITGNSVTTGTMTATTEAVVPAGVSAGDAARFDQTPGIGQTWQSIGVPVVGTIIANSSNKLQIVQLNYPATAVNGYMFIVSGALAFYKVAAANGISDSVQFAVRPGDSWGVNSVSTITLATSYVLK